MPATDPRLDLLESRRLRSAGQQVNNDRLPAGAPMYYYCKACGVHTSTKPEGWFMDPPPTYCGDCSDLIHDGVIDRTNTFTDWCEANGKEQYANA